MKNYADKVSKMSRSGVQNVRDGILTDAGPRQLIRFFVLLDFGP